MHHYFATRSRLQDFYSSLVSFATLGKDYISSYRDLHYRYQIETAVNIGFWWDAPVDRRTRQTLEQAMIQKWRSPFNKENWERWGQPFK
ncbi:hypothetical protein [Nostoc favosum]|uniref:hypothetical protein n=1 Tax=Nostoc favosum TaxID=2907819 RepID=UPI00279639F8|nr:hypothetical protein [Nostoc favosum]